MKLERVPGPGGAPEEAALRRELEADGFEVVRWSDAPGKRYAPHHHAHDERIWLLEGGICFEAGGQTLALAPGDRLELPGGTLHSARVGASGATYLIGQRS